MKIYPIRVPLDIYKGANETRRAKQSGYNRLAQLIETYINQTMATEPDDTVRTFRNYEIAEAVRADLEIVRKIVYGIDAGSGGVTVLKGDLDRALAPV